MKAKTSVGLAIVGSIRQVSRALRELPAELVLYCPYHAQPGRNGRLGPRGASEAARRSLRRSIFDVLEDREVFEEPDFLVFVELDDI